ncbi:MAG: enoyl-ACP reductase [bacterium]|nr:enoyl-ACP reductase [bacterium]
MELLAGKSGLVVGAANHRSLAWHIAQAAAESGARVVLTYQNERLGENVRKLAGGLPGALTFPCDVTAEDDLGRLEGFLGDELAGLDWLVHSVAWARREELEGEFLGTSREGFREAHDVSAYSLVALARLARPLMRSRGGGSILTLTFAGSERVFPGYNVMGTAKASLEAAVRYLAHDLGKDNIRVNAISAGPVRTLAASGVRGLVRMLELYRERAPLRRSPDATEVADAALFLLSPMSRGVTGEVLHVDGGYHVTGV